MNSATALSLQGTLSKTNVRPVPPSEAHGLRGPEHARRGDGRDPCGCEIELRTATEERLDPNLAIGIETPMFFTRLG
jgi:hypothetical protein